MKNSIFWLFGILQSLSLAAVIFVLFQSMNRMSDSRVIGPDSQIVLSLAFPIFLLLVEYTIYNRVEK